MKKITLGIVLLGLLTACGPKNLGESELSNLNSLIDSGSVETVPTWDSVELQAKSTGGPYSNLTVVYIDKVNQAILLTLPLPVYVPIFTSLEIPEIPGAKFVNYTFPNGTKSIAISIPLKYLMKRGQFIGGSTLPNGDPLPYIPEGELPGFALSFPPNPNFRIFLYVGVNAAAAFVEVPGLDLPSFPLSWLPFGGGWNTSVKVVNKAAQQEVGYLSYVGKKGIYPGGIYLAARLPVEVANVIDNLIRW